MGFVLWEVRGGLEKAALHSLLLEQCQHQPYRHAIVPLPALVTSFLPSPFQKLTKLWLVLLPALGRATSSTSTKFKV